MEIISWLAVATIVGFYLWQYIRPRLRPFESEEQRIKRLQFEMDIATIDFIERYGKEYAMRHGIRDPRDADV